MSIDAALVKEQGVTFAVVCVKAHIINDRRRSDELINSFSPKFGRVPVVLMGGGRRSTFYGRQDLVRWLRKVPVRALPWKRWSI